MTTPTAILTDPGFTLTVHVTPTDIEAGIRQDCTACPVAIATARALSLACDEWAETVEAYEAAIDVFFDSEPLVRAYPPQEVRDFMWRFDNASWVEPFTFGLSFYRPLRDRPLPADTAS
jgi:hypothetical protein